MSWAQKLSKPKAQAQFSLICIKFKYWGFFVHFEVFKYFGHVNKKFHYLKTNKSCQV